jgi:hypothetical protein
MGCGPVRPLLINEPLLNFHRVFSLFWDWKVTLFLQALNRFIQALFHWGEFDAQILDLLVCELVGLFSWILLI